VSSGPGGARLPGDATEFAYSGRYSSGMAIVKRIYRVGELDALLSGGQPATADDVSMTTDGRQLDTAEAVIEFFDELSHDRVEPDGTPGCGG